MVRYSFIFVKKLISLSLLAFVIFLIISLLTFNPADPSLLKASDNNITNIMGALGSNFADAIVQSLGFTVILPLIFLLVLGVKLLIGLPNKLLLVRLICLLIIAMPSLAISLSILQGDKIKGCSKGGYFGDFLKYHLIGHFDQLILFIVTVSLVVAGSIFCMGLTFQEWKKVLKVIYLSVCKFFKIIISSIKYALKICKMIINKIKVTDEELIENSIRQNDDPEIKVEEEINHSPDNIMDAHREKQILPPYHLLKNVPSLSKKNKNLEDSLLDDTDNLSRVLVDFGIKGGITNVSSGPVVTLYEFEPAAGTKSSRIICLADDIARSMSATSARIAVMPGKNALGIELPNESREIVYLRELFESVDYQNSDVKLPLVLGKNIGGHPVIADLAKMPHLLVAGTTGSGKSVAINTMILSILYKLTAEQCKFVMIDPKMLELSVYEGIPHLLSPVVTEPKKAISALKWVVQEMEKRYRLMSMLGVRNITGYNDFIKEKIDSGQDLEKKVQTGFDPSTGEPLFEQIKIDDSPLPYIVVIVDEMADLMLVAGKEIEGYIQRIAQMARAAGIHLIMATQRPSVDVITGVIKANFPTRISFQVTSKIDSRTILGEQGAEQLLGMGDMLFMMAGGRVERVHAPFVNDNEVEKVVAFLKKQGKPEYVKDILNQQEGESELGAFSMQKNGDESDIYKQAISIVLTDKKATTSYLQRKLKIGYNRAASLIEKMEEEGIVSSPNHVGRREILIKQQE